MTASDTLSDRPAPRPGAGGYRGVTGHWDEAVAAEGMIRPHWRQLFGALERQTPHESQDNHDLCRRLLKEYGVTYNAPGTSDERPWQLDSWPLVISPSEWELLRRGVAQRAKLLNLILADIYGPRRLVHGGGLPPEVVLANPAFHRAAAGVVPPSGTHLHFYAVDVARSPDGRWWVLGDRTDTPAGAGYALENRIVMGRVYPDLIRDCMVERLASFFAQFRDHLLARASSKGSEPRVVILTPGPYHSIYFEQVYLARYLGFTLVEGEDLTVRDGGVYLKSLSGLLPVDVILRRVGSDFCDPLELRDDSLLGVPGLLQAARAGKVVLANAIGAGVVETPALLPFLPGLCRQLLDEELLLTPVATWWCGQEEALKTVLGRLGKLVIKHAFPTRDTNAYLPGKHSSSEFRALLLSNPHLFVGQEYVHVSTAPTWHEQKLEPRHFMLRLYAVAGDDSEYHVMPGGLTRCGNSPDSVLLSAQAVGSSKDTWVLSDSPPDTSTTLLPSGSRSSALSRADFILPSRLADNLFWLGRYMERIEFGCRIARCLLQRMTDESERGRLGTYAFALDVFAAHGRMNDGEFSEDFAADESRFSEMLALAVFHLDNPFSIASDIARVQRISTAVRARLSTDSFKLLRSLSEAMPQSKAKRTPRPEEWLASIDVLLSQVLTFSGQMMDGMTRDKGWRFLDSGRRLERAADMSDLIRLAMVQVEADETSPLQAVLEIANSAMTYRSRYVFGPDPAPVLDLLLGDESNPRSVAFQLGALYQHMRSFRGKQEGTKSREQRIVQTIFSRLRLIDVDALTDLKEGGRRVRLATLLEEVTSAMEQLSRSLTRSYLTHVQSARPLGQSQEPGP